MRRLFFRLFGCAALSCVGVADVHAAGTCVVGSGVFGNAGVVSATAVVVPTVPSFVVSPLQIVQPVVVHQQAVQPLVVRQNVVRQQVVRQRIFTRVR